MIQEKMGKRRNKELEKIVGLVFVIGIGMSVIRLLATFFQKNSTGIEELLAVTTVLIGAIICTKIVTKLVTGVIAKSHVLKEVEKALSRNIPNLSRRKLQLVQKDAYGRIIYEKWLNEIKYFIDHQIRPQLNQSEFKALQKNLVEIMRQIDLKVDEENRKNPIFRTFFEGMTPNEFETFTAEALSRAGWNARVTMRSRDQGVDVIAEKNGVHVVLQCKLYARPVGNKAVQEVAAARQHEGADYAIVVSNNRYTASAEQLARTNNVLLLHYSELARIEQRLLELRPPENDFSKM